MNFLEKTLESIIYANYEACEERGLAIHADGRHGEYYPSVTRLRQVQLAPYGVADLINIYYQPRWRSLLIQVIECKKDKLDLSAYAQAKRYARAMRDVLEMLPENAGIGITIETVLIGSSFELSGDFCYVYNEDESCLAYTYSYEIDGINFTEVEKTWRVAKSRESNSLRALAQSLANEFAGADIEEAQRVEAVAEAKRSAEAEQAATKAEWVAKHGDPESVLMIGSEGIIINQAWANWSNDPSVPTC